ncbi:DUF5665 domain-containing protein [Paenibacillus sp. SC116]|uniref:DUF5665 domain-containing protein n=1 Tax=Paenibacillus sp. SC116 TaxID=2968986 RepID=UPI00215A27F6|nr:DUF5665 domain-containing protein [Paenibacillus sp. SC116]MCR8845729.1 DUF5665 domain-containing protein [Paenibacillus sp. SC116]
MKKRKRTVERVEVDMEQLKECLDDKNKSDREIIEGMHALLQKISLQFERSRMLEYTELMLNMPRLLWVNFVAGVARGVGVVIGITFVTVLLLYVLQWLGALNLPLIGDFIADIVRIVQSQLDSKMY